MFYLTFEDGLQTNHVMKPQKTIGYFGLVAQVGTIMTLNAFSEIYTYMTIFKSSGVTRKIMYIFQCLGFYHVCFVIWAFKEQASVLLNDTVPCGLAVMLILSILINFGLFLFPRLVSEEHNPGFSLFKACTSGLVDSTSDESVKLHSKF